jgi:DNA-binding NtrC family response regulator
MSALEPVLCVGPRHPAIEGALAGAGMRVHWAENRRAALAALAEGRFSLCLLDLGNDAVRTARAIRSGCPTAVIIGVADPDGTTRAAEAMRAGLADVVSSSPSPRELESILENAREHTARADAAGPMAIPAELAGDSSLARTARAVVGQLAAASCQALVVGEPGLDVRAVAREIHARGPRADAPFLEIDCGAPAVELQIFGNRASAREGLERVEPDAALARAARGTLFLASLLELPAAAQARVARVSRDREVALRGERMAAPRLIAGADAACDRAVETGDLRADLARRLGVGRIDVPPIRQRPEDVPAMVEIVASSLAGRSGDAPLRFTHAALVLLAALPWRGNVSELRGVVEALARVEAPVLRVEEVLQLVRLDGLGGPAPGGTLADARARFERDYIAAVLRHHHWRMSDAAKTLGIQRPNLYRKARQLGILRVKPPRRST